MNATTTRTAHWTRAQATIKAHGFEAYQTPDGLLALMPTSWVDAIGPDQGDRHFDEPAVFPLRDGDMVDMRAVSRWLGH